MAEILNRRPNKRDDNSLYQRARKYFGSWNNLMKSAGYSVRYYQRVTLPLLNEDFAYFLGLLITDGHIYYNSRLKKYKVAIYTSYPEEREMIVKLVQHLFNYNSGISSRMYGFNKKPNYEVRISCKKLADYLIQYYNIPSGPKSLVVRVPKMIMQADLVIKKSFIRGVIDGDGSVLKDTIKIASGSHQFLEDIKKILSDLSISSWKIIKNNKSGTTYSLRSNKTKHLSTFESISNSEYFYRRKAESIGKV